MRRSLPGIQHSLRSRYQDQNTQICNFADAGVGFVDFILYKLGCETHLTTFLLCVSTFNAKFQKHK